MRLIRFLGFCVLLTILGAVGSAAYRQFLPCRSPLILTIGNIDERFGVRASEFQQHVEEAAMLWEDAIGKDLFAIEPAGGMPVSAVYDHRQEALVKLKELGIRLDSGEDSYDAIRARYDTLQTQYENRIAKYTADTAAFEKRKTAFETKVEAADDAPLTPEAYAALEAEREAINAQVPALEKEFQSLEAQRRDLNGVVAVLNRLAAEHNQYVDSYKGIGSALGEQYEAGLYEQRNGEARITVFAFVDRDELTRLLAHELGHALGLPHIDDPTAIMYALNESKNSALAATDVQAIQERCGL